MASTNGTPTDPLIAKLKERPFDFDFYAAVRLLQSKSPDKPRIGRSRSPVDDPVRFAQSPSLAFAPSTIEKVVQTDNERPPVLYSRHFGLFGPNGPLPLCLTEYAHERALNHGDPTFSAFANVFHHRLASLFFRAWAEPRKNVDYDRPDSQNWDSFVGSLVGLGMESHLRRDRVDDRSKLFAAGRLVQQSRNAEGLEAIVQDYFGIRAEVHTFVGRWMDLPPDSTCRLGDSPSTGTLGSTAIAGSRIWTCQLHFRLQMGPMKRADLDRMLPTGEPFQRLRDWIRLYTSGQYSWDVQLILAKEEVPEVVLGQSGRLGWTTWLKTEPFKRDAVDLVLRGEDL